MKLFAQRRRPFIFWGAWLLLLATSTWAEEVEVTAGGETNTPCDCTAQVAAKDCSPQIQAAVQPLLAVQTEADKKLANTIEELDEIIEERNRA